MPGYLGNFQSFEKFPKSSKFTTLKSPYLVNFPDTQAMGKFLFLTFLIIAVTPSRKRGTL